jgi:hypothetical protein
MTTGHMTSMARTTDYAVTRPFRMKVVTGCLALIAALGLSMPSPAAAQVADQPAATLLLPYFEVDLGDPTGTTTLFSVNNASATAILANVTIWSDLGVPVLGFTIYLTGYDVQTVDLGEIVVRGAMVRTASVGQDPQDNISNQGEFSQDINFASCNGQLPFVQLPANYITHLQKSLTGQASPILGNLCAGVRYPAGNIARGYVTVNTVNACVLKFPGDPDYFRAGGTGDATNQNVLWGDYFLVKKGGGIGLGEPMVHIRAAALDTETSVAGQYTFYGRHVAWAAIDNREPLSTRFAARFVSGGAFTGGTELIVWRDPKVKQTAFTCPAVLGVRPSWYPLNQEQVAIFNDQEGVTLVDPVVMPFPAASQRVPVGSANLPVPYASGWLLLNLNTTVIPAGSNPPEDPAAAQAWVVVHHLATGRFSAGFAASLLDSAMNAVHTIVSPP